MFEIYLYIFSYDVWFYVSHVILHQYNMYKKIHKYHHSVEYSIMTYPDTYVGHYLESCLQGVGICIPLLWVTINWSFMIALVFINIRGMMRHDIRCVPWIGNHHILHHKYPNYNFGEYWLDRLCGTNYPNKNEYKVGLIYL